MSETSTSEGGLLERVLARPLVYRAWQAPFVRKKIKPLQRRLDPTQPGRLLDIGCGPGTNAFLFPGESYVGVDLNPSYIRYARRKFPGRFEVWDVTTPGPNLGKFDTVLINSVFHHLSDLETAHVLGSLADHVNSDGRVFIIDLVLPRSRGLPRLLANLDRGYYPRQVDHWLRLFGEHLTITHTESFSVKLLGIPLWKLVLVEARTGATSISRAGASQSPKT
jgi:SAM-dependent methyltransferase